MSRPLKGRGAASNPADRFARTTTEEIDDGWFTEPAPDSIATSVQPERARSVITTNDSPDVAFEYSINPYRGCEHGCCYCLRGDTPILMGDGTTRALAEVGLGDEIYGTVRQGWFRRYVKTQVLAKWSVIKPSYQIRLADGTAVTASPDHRFLTERGWKFVTGSESGRGRRPHLTTGNKLMGTGAFASAPEKNGDYRSGYLCGLIRGDGFLGKGMQFSPLTQTISVNNQFRLALCDEEALDRAQGWLRGWGVETSRFAFAAAAGNRRAATAIRTSTLANMGAIRSLILFPSAPGRSWCAGFLAGIFDAEGSYSQGVLRISSTDPQIIDYIRLALQRLNFVCVIEHTERPPLKPIAVVRLLGGLQEHLRFFHTVDPAITRKRDIAGQAVKCQAQLGVTSIERLHGAMRLYDITTGTGDFVANGVVSHNCYARPSHAYMGLSPGLDFETKLFYKEDAARLLSAELARPGYRCKPITLGANTDPYQPIEKQLGVTRSVLEVLRSSHHPVSIVTKSTLILRDLPLLAEMAREGLASVMVSLTSLDAELKRRMEPRAAAPKARLEVIRQLARAGVPVGTLIAPVIPALTDHELESLVAAAAEAGVATAGYVLLRLPHELKDLFREWLETHYPLRAQHVMSIMQSLRGGRDNDPRFHSRMRGEGPFAELLRTRFRIACQRHGLNARQVTLTTARFQPPRPSSPQMLLEL